jgi:hypothetical protein
VAAADGCNCLRNGSHDVSWNTNVHCPWFELRLGESECMATSEIAPSVFYLWRQSGRGLPPHLAAASLLISRRNQVSLTPFISKVSFPAQSPVFIQLLTPLSVLHVWFHFTTFWFDLLIFRLPFFYARFVCVCVCFKLIVTVMNDGVMKLKFSSGSGHFLAYFP